MDIPSSFEKYAHWFANAIVTLGLLGASSLFAYGLHTMGARPEWGRAIAVSAVAIFTICGLLFRANINTRVNLSISLFSIGVAIFAINFVAVAYQHLTSTEYDQLGYPSKYDVFKDMRAEGIDAYPVVPPYLVGRYKPWNPEDILPTSGISEVTTIHCDDSGHRQIYESDRYGFNNEDKVYDRTGPLILLIGDSFTHGSCVQQGDDAAGQLREFGLRAISMGMAGNGPLIELATLREYAHHLKPDVVLWMFTEKNDMGNLGAEYRSGYLKKYLERSFTQKLITRQPEINEFWKRRIEKRAIELESEERVQPQAKYISYQVRRIFTLGAIRELLGWHGMQSNPPTEELYGVLSEILSQANDEVREWDGRMYFVFIPSFYRFIHAPGIEPINREKIFSAVSNIGIPLIDFYPDVAEYDDPLSVFRGRIDNHFNEYGYNRLAAKIANQLVSDFGFKINIKEAPLN
tara:strand:+ start:5630 stop:7015 length:1386 start_codon:yes stop_codon:yes gene_type:complete